MWDAVLCLGFNARKDFLRPDCTIDCCLTESYINTRKARDLDSLLTYLSQSLFWCLINIRYKEFLEAVEWSKTWMIYIQKVFRTNRFTAETKNKEKCEGNGKVKKKQTSRNMRSRYSRCHSGHTAWVELWVILVPLDLTQYHKCLLT